jgi:hypothetical protein
VAPSLATTQPTPTAAVEPPQPPGSQAAHPVLGGTGWTVTELVGVPPLDNAWLSFWVGPHARGTAKSTCSFVFFEYSYDPQGSSIELVPYADGEGSYADGCTAAALAQYDRIRATLAHVAAWRMPSPERLELLDGSGTIALQGQPLPPLPTPPVPGDCGSVPAPLCNDAAIEAFNFGLFLASGQRVVAWRVRDTIYTDCDGGAAVPKFDVIFGLANPTEERITTVGDLYGQLHACPSY